MAFERLPDRTLISFRNTDILFKKKAFPRWRGNAFFLFDNNLISSRFLGFIHHPVGAA